LSFNAAEGALGLGFNRADRLAVYIEEIICRTETGFQLELTNGDTSASG
jgi:hypothetical protein